MTTEWFLPAGALATLADRLLSVGQRVVAPAAGDDGAVDYRPLDAPVAHLDLDTAVPRRSLKEQFLPPTEPLLRWTRTAHDVALEPAAVAPAPTVVLGARPCDAAALPILDHVMDWDHRDLPWFERRAATTIVAVACVGHDSTCFCSAVGLGPDSDRGADVMLTPVVDGFVGHAVTGRGAALVEAHPDLFRGAAPEQAAAGRSFREGARARVAEHLALDRHAVADWLAAHFDDAVWAAIPLRCHGCGACASVCPTCHCFDIVDEPEGPLAGTRRRNWDTCQAPRFTVHASGHDPRPDRASRFRQRVMHKFSFYPSRFDETLCTGCGRCARACPAGMDLPEILSAIARRGETP